MEISKQQQQKQHKNRKKLYSNRLKVYRLQREILPFVYFLLKILYIFMVSTSF